MHIFNDLISNLELIDIPFSGRSFTWSNMQVNPLLVKLDWVFCNPSWSLKFPGTSVQPLSKPISDHIPYVTSFGSNIPRASIFRFENSWAEHPDFLKTVELHWNSSPYFASAARIVSAEFKQTRAGLKQWRKGFQNVNKLLHNSDWVLMLLDGLEEQRPLSTLELALRGLVKRHIINLLESKRTYWRQRNTVRWIKLGDVNTSFFQAMASISHRRNSIGSLSLSEDIIVTNHEQKAGILWEAFKNRLGISEYSGMAYDLESILQRHQLDFLAEDFSEEDYNKVILEIPNNHSRGLDGFNGKFIKKCWPIIKPDFIRLFSEFFFNTIDLTSINSSYITLIPKKNNPEFVND